MEPILLSLVDLEDVNHSILDISVSPFDDRYHKVNISGWKKSYLIKIKDLEKLNLKNKK